MFDRDFRGRLIQEIKNLVPLFRYLILQTETHAFCLALAGAALLAFFPSCLVALAIFKRTLHWDNAYNVLLSTVQSYFTFEPKGQITYNLAVRLRQMGRGTGMTSLLWVLLGAAGVFIPLETGLNRLWHVEKDRPYWLNQIVGFTLTVVCIAIGLVFLSISTPLHWVVNYFPFEIFRAIMHLVIIRVTMTCFFVLSIFA